MRQQQFIRFVQQICYLLKLSQPCSKTALQYFLQFKQYQGHEFDHEIMIASCIYLSTKIFQQQVRVRDILNMIYVLTRGYKLARYQQQQIRGKRFQGKRMGDYQQQKKRQDRQSRQGREHDSLQKQQLIKQHEQNKQIVISNKDDVNNNYNKNQEVIQSQKKQQQQNNQHKQQKSSQQPKNIQPQQQHQHQHKHLSQHQNQQLPQHQHQKQQFILLKTIQKHPNLQELIQPQYSLSDYNQYKSKIIQAQQTLLRVIGFDFSLSQKNKTQLKQLLITIHYMHIPATISQTILKVYNDVHYIDVGCWLEGVVYFGYLLVKNLVVVNEKEKQQQLNKMVTQNNKHQSRQKQHNLKQHKQRSQKQIKQIKRINQFINKMNKPQQWQLLLCTTIKQLQHYAEKLTNFYLSIEID